MADSEPKETWDINLRVGEERMTLAIPRSPGVEQALRKAAEQVNSTLERYRVSFPHASREQLMSYVALDIANKLQRMRIEDRELELAKRLRQLNEALERSL